MNDKEKLAVVESLLKNALDMFSGELGLCYEPNTPEWVWRWRVKYYFHETEIPVHELPEDMKG